MAPVLSVAGFMVEGAVAFTVEAEGSMVEAAVASTAEVVAIRVGIGKPAPVPFGNSFEEFASWRRDGGSFRSQRVRASQ